MSMQRMTALRGALLAQSLDALVVSQPENRRYLSGFTGSAGLLLITAELSLLLTDSRYVEQAARQAADFRVVQIANSDSRQLAALLEECQLKRVAFESGHLTVAHLRRWQDSAPQVDWVSSEGLVESLRMVKQPDELQAIRTAAGLADEAFSHLINNLHPGVTERQVAWELEVYMRTHGASKVAFDLIVAAGSNGAMPHATVSDREIQPGEPIVIDLGAVFDGYHSDMTRTVCLGRPDERFEEIYSVVLAAQQAAEAALRPGLTGQEVDQIARRIIDEAGFSAEFGHGLGHGVGLAIHEGPRLGQTATDVLQPNMVVTVEPGIYLPGWGGVRVEDLVIITAEGCEVLTGASKEPLLAGGKTKYQLKKGPD